MRVLIVFCHPSQSSFTAEVYRVVHERLCRAGAQVRSHDLYQMAFDPALSQADWSGYLTFPENTLPLASEIADLKWCDTLIFIYPTWWYGAPAKLKGWLDRLLLPGVAFHLPQSPDTKLHPNLTHIKTLAVSTTCGASWWVSRWMGEPGKTLLLRGVGLLCHKRCQKVFLALYNMEKTTAQSRAKHLLRVAQKIDSLLTRAD